MFEAGFVAGRATRTQYELRSITFPFDRTTNNDAFVSMIVRNIGFSVDPSVLQTGGYLVILPEPGLTAKRGC